MDPKTALKNAGAEQANVVGGARTKPATYVPAAKEASPEMKSILYGTSTATDNVITTTPGAVPAEKPIPKADLREIANHVQNKPSPKLQPHPTNPQMQRIYQPL
ncbi:hypothetical protein JH06_5248 [Blastocystis sp. subtype 4]|uniref:hypothetical protein n=1 Tax=Blastocystis sp. subtype 4 TaxID=944170 RepID=UPI000711BA38|nr:hypothetical protein JH06_5248 [Blastocystis sp. subtype 4]KNB41397.1 hypothetical protein JH06_5248 [Blastocystis sp. subtype 4]|eukprot:XP_014524840.1 hypothetical protein JH06_5248 [Blastocystis sp. subtype 4]